MNRDMPTNLSAIKSRTKRPWAGALLSLPLLVLLLLWGLPVGSARASSDRMSQAAVCYAQRSDLTQARRAAELYRQALRDNPHSEEAACRLSQTLYWIGIHVPHGDEELAVMEEAVQAASRAIAINPDSIPGHYLLGVCYGTYGVAKGVLKSLSLVEPIKREMDFVIQRDPGFEDGGAHLVLGRLYYKLPGLVGGSDQKAEEHLRLAIKSGPRRWINYLFLAELYKSQGKYDKARPLLEAILAGPPQKGLEPEYADWRGDAERMLREIRRP